MTKVLIVHPRIRETSPAQHIPFGAAMVASVCDAVGVNTAVLDLNAARIGLDAFRHEIRLDEWDMVCLSALSSQYKYVKQLLPVIRKEHPDALVVGGGGCFTTMPKEMLRWNKGLLDVICIGEGENVMVELLDVIYSRRFDEVRGLAYMEKGKVKFTEPRPLIGMPDSGTFESLDDLPYPSYGLLPMEVYLRNSKLPLCPETMRPDLRRISVVSERGCPFSCRFCSHLGQSCSDLSRIYGRKIKGPNMRWQSAEYLVNHIKYLRLKFAVNFVSILDENFLANKKRCLEFADLMEKEGLAGVVKFGVLGHPVSVKPDVMAKLGDIGCCYVSIGAESADQHVLNALNKKSTPQQIQTAINVCMKYEVYPITTWMITQDDSVDSILATVRFWKRNQITCKPFIETSYPGTKLFEDNKEKIIDYFLEDDEKERIVKLEKEGENEKIEEIKSRALERYVLQLGDATDLVVNLHPRWNTLEMLGLQQLMFLKDEKRIRKLAKLRKR